MLLEAARDRLSRVRAWLRGEHVTAAVLHDPAVVRSLTAVTSPHGWPAALVVTEGRTVAVLFGRDEQPAAVDEQILLAGIRRDGPVVHTREIASAVKTIIAKAAMRGPVAVDVASAPGWLWRLLEDLGAREGVVDAGPELIRLRRHKGPDELAVIRMNIRLAESAYRAAARTIRPDVTELDVYWAMTRAMEEIAGTAVPFGGDFSAGPGGGTRGGPPSARVLEDGDAYVIDLFPSLGGYHGDMCRTFPVGRIRPALAQAVALVDEAIGRAESIIKPGVRTALVDDAVRQVLGRRPDLGGGGYFHMTGHGIGIAAHEAPWLGATSEEAFTIGDVVAIEPGLYADALKGGVRIEDCYVVVEDGLENLCALPRIPFGGDVDEA